MRFTRGVSLTKKNYENRGVRGAIISANHQRIEPSGPLWDTGANKAENIRHITRWVRGNQSRIDKVLAKVQAKITEKANYPTSGEVPNTRYINLQELTQLPGFGELANAISFCHDVNRKCEPYTKDGYLTVDAIYNMSAWENWKSSSLSAGERKIAESIAGLHLLELMQLNKGRRKDQPALFPKGLLK